MSIPDFTLVIAVDAGCAARILLSWPTWMQHKPELRDVPVLVVHDARFDPRHPALTAVRRHAGVRFIAWSMPEAETQRERMLTALVRIPAEQVQTPWYLKLDLDAVATGPGTWIRPEWFDCDDRGRLPAFVASPWGYTKPPEAIGRLDDWADGITGLRERPRLNLPVSADGSRVRHPRVTSWCFFGNTDWTRRVSRLAPGRLPVPSHDTFLSYCAARLGDHLVRVRMALHGWQHISGFGRFRRRCLEVVSGDV